MSLVNKVHCLIKDHLQLTDIAIDATVGNGYDTLFLAQRVGKSGHVFGFDIQANALEITRKKLLSANLTACLTLIEANHALMTEKIPVQYQQKIKAIMFNLGYLPGGDKTLITRTDSTLLALAQACRLVSKQGVITVVTYPGHAGGETESQAVAQWCGQLDKRQFSVITISAEAQKASAPLAYAIAKY
jgi:predicted methyltransferase